MGTRVGLAVAAATVLLVTASPSAAADGTGGPDREAFILAGWSGVDGDTGAERSRTVIASGREGDAVLVEYSVNDSMPIDCPDGSDGLQWTEGGGGGQGRLVVDRNLDAAHLDAVVDVETTTWTFCGEGADPVVAPLGPTTVSVNLVGDGLRSMQSGGGRSARPSQFEVHWASRSIGRQAQGTFTADGEQFTTQFGEFGFVRSRVHEHTTGHLETELAAIATRLAWTSRTTSSAGTEVGTMDRAEGIWDQVDGDVYEGIYVGADRTRGDDTELFYQRYATRPLDCGDGTTATLDEFGFGVGPGELTLRGHLDLAEATGTVDIVTEALDGCSGGATTARSRAPVRLELTGSGPVNRGHEWERYHVPSVANTTTWSGVRRRAATGLLQVDGAELPTTFGQLLVHHWRMSGD